MPQKKKKNCHLDLTGFLVQCNLDLVTLLVSTTIVTKSHNVTKLNDYKFFKKYSMKTPKLKSISSESATNLKKISHSVLACT